MKHNVVVAAGTQVFEFDGEILELEDTHILLRAKRGDIYIERKYLVFIQTLNEEVMDEKLYAEQINEPEKSPMPVIVRNPKIDPAAKFIKQRLKQDPFEHIFEEKIIPPSQFPDHEEDMEAMKNVAGAFHGPNHPLNKATNLQEAIKVAMNNANKEVSLSMGSVEYKNPLQTVLGMTNGSKKIRNS